MNSVLICMKNSGNYRHIGDILRNALRVMLLSAFLSLAIAHHALAQDGVAWATPIQLSDNAELAGTPALIADNAGNVHVIWPQRASDDEPAALFYAQWDGRQWTSFRDVLVSPGGGDANSPDLAYTADGWLHVLWSTGTQRSTLFYSHAPACCAENPHNWSPPIQLISSAAGTGALVADQQGRLHAAGALQDGSSIAYRRSDDGGATWPTWVEIPGGSTQTEDYPIYPRLAVDGRGRVHLVWNVQAFPGRLVMYARSDDSGDTWSVPREIDNAARSEYVSGYGPNFIDIEAYGDDHVHLIWNGAPTVERNHVWSADGGNSWSEPTLLFPEITVVGRAGWNDMVFDSAGVLHAVALGQPWSASWSGGSWSQSAPIGQQPKAEWMRAAQGLGSQLHVVWLNYVDSTDRTVWYTTGTTAAPATQPQPLLEPVTDVFPTPTPPSADDNADPSSVPTATPGPVQKPRLSGGTISVGSLSTGTAVALSIIPAFLMIAAVLAVKLLRSRR